MVKQNDPKCLPVVQQVGCFMRSCGAMAELKTQKELTVAQVNELWRWGKLKGHIDEYNNIKQSAPIATKALEMLGDKGRFIEIGTFRDGTTYYYPSINWATRSLPKYFIQKINTSGMYGTHFRNVDFRGKLLFDPYTPDVMPTKIRYSIIYVYAEAKK